MGRTAASQQHKKCTFCRGNGASIGCVTPRCRVGFHFPCGLEHDALNQFFGCYNSYCKEHRPRQTFERGLEEQSHCVICFNDISKSLPDDILFTPCCRNAGFHRSCMQRYASNSGSYFFCCPICKDSDLFEVEMKRMGIYIPIQDASWEEDVGLTQTHSSCDVSVCRCPKGRSYSECSQLWELILCADCGSYGSHLHCSRLKKPVLRRWICPPCRDTGISRKRPVGFSGSELARKKIPRTLEQSDLQGGNQNPKMMARALSRKTTSVSSSTTLNRLESAENVPISLSTSEMDCDDDVQIIETSHNICPRVSLAMEVSRAISRLKNVVCDGLDVSDFDDSMTTYMTNSLWDDITRSIKSGEYMSFLDLPLVEEERRFPGMESGDLVAEEENVSKGQRPSEFIDLWQISVIPKET